MIDEKKLIEELYALADKESQKCDEAAAINLMDIVAKYNHGESCYYNAVETVKGQPEIGGWILCSERLPENRKNVLVCWGGNNVSVGYYVDGGLGGWFFEPLAGGYKIPYEPFAWQPLPETYHEPLEGLEER